jgi:hypothetical protein
MLDCTADDDMVVLFLLWCELMYERVAAASASWLTC